MNVILKSWEAKSLLLNHIGQNPPGVVVGSATQAPRGYYSCSVEGASGSLHIGVIANQPKVPSVVYLAKSQLTILGYDQSVALVDYPSATLRQTTALDGVFFEFLWDEERAQVLVINELGVVAISELGLELWRYTTSDILEEWGKANDRLVLTLMDTSASVELMLEDGAPVSSTATPDSPPS